MPTAIPRAEAFEFEWRLERKNDVTGQLEPLPGETTVTAWLSATFKGDPIVVGSELPLTQRGIELRTDSRVLWYGIVAAADVTTALTGLVAGTTVYEVVEVEGERKSNALTVED